MDKDEEVLVHDNAGGQEHPEDAFVQYFKDVLSKYEALVDVEKHKRLQRAILQHVTSS
jgi:hypothetical protein